MYFETIEGDNELVIEQEKKCEKKLYNDEDESYFLALKLHEQLNGYLFQSDNKHLKIIDQQWELIDPTPDIYKLFNQFNLDFFYDKLSSVFVQWSSKMTRSIENRIRYIIYKFDIIVVLVFVFMNQKETFVELHLVNLCSN